MILIEKTKHKSVCCKKPIYIERIGEKGSDSPYCSKCLKQQDLNDFLNHIIEAGFLLHKIKTEINGRNGIHKNSNTEGVVGTKKIL